MTVVVFTGPTLSPEDARRELDALYLPPVSQGDVYRATQLRPRAIGIVDGYFERVPAVWHKEILWAMTRGIHVFGSASMGALRAAELAPFGMEGVGAVFQAFRDGTLEDDDEVAVAHGPAEMDYRGQSDAMANIRYTLARAGNEGVISPSSRDTLQRIAKSLFYPDRSYRRVLEIALERGVPVFELDALRAWLPRGQINQKREDALAMLRVMRERIESGLPPKRVRFSFQHTVFWDRARVEAARPESDGQTSESLPLERLLDELRLSGSYRAAWRGAMARALGVDEARRRGARAGPEMLQETAASFRRERGLLSPQEAERWMAENGLDDDQVRLLMEDEALLRWIENRVARDVTARLPDHLRSTGEFPALFARALHKQRVLESRGLETPGLRDLGLTEEELFRWYFDERLGVALPADLKAYARAAGFDDMDSFTRAVLRDFCYCYNPDTDDRDAPTGSDGHRGEDRDGAAKG